jgi:hypothetical protein
MYLPGDNFLADAALTRDENLGVRPREAIEFLRQGRHDGTETEEWR